MGAYILHQGASYLELFSKPSFMDVEKVFKATQVLDVAGINYAQFQGSNRFSIKKVYNNLRGCYQKVHWRRLICNNHVTSKWLFILYLAIHKRLYTR